MCIPDLIYALCCLNENILVHLLFLRFPKKSTFLHFKVQHKKFLKSYVLRNNNYHA
jgi:hypothetical protein